MQNSCNSLILSPEDLPKESTGEQTLNNQNDYSNIDKRTGGVTSTDTCKTETK